MHRKEDTTSPRFDALVQHLLDGHYDHYACELPERGGFIQDRVLRRLFLSVKMDEDVPRRLFELASQGKIIYAVKHRSSLDFLFFRHRLKGLGLPVPRIAFSFSLFLFQPIRRQFRILLSGLLHWLKFGKLPDPFERGYFFRRLEDGEGAMCFLIDAPHLTQRVLHPEKDPFFHLVRLYQDKGETLIIAPLMIMFEKGPEREEKGLLDIFFGPRDCPGRIRRLVRYLFYRGQAFVEMADPVTVGWFVDRESERGLKDEELAYELREHLIGHVDRQKKVITGPTLKSRSQIMEQVLRDPYLNQEMDRIAREENRDLVRVRRDAATYLNEMAADYSQTMVEFLDRVLTWVWNSLYDGIEVDEEGLNRAREKAKRSPVVYVPSHKSHIDYLVLSYVLYHRNIVPPHIWAGINLSFFPLGYIFRRAGAFFIRRSFRGNRVYADVLVRYLKVLIAEGFNLEFFIEGGRSRTGRVLLPRLGVLKYICQAYNEGAARDIYFVPISIGYDQILEEGEYLEEMHGIKNPRSSPLEILRNRHLIRKRYGHIYINFGEPISLKDHLAEAESPESSEGGLESAVYESLAVRIIRTINQASVVTPFSLVAAALLTKPQQGITHEELLDILALYYQYLLEEGAILSESFDNFDWAMEEVISLYCERKLIDRDDELGGGDRFYTIHPDQRLSLEIYRNYLLHFVLPGAYTALSLLSQDHDAKEEERLNSDYQFLKELFRYEFVYSDERTEALRRRRALEYFEHARHLGEEGPGFSLTEKGQRELAYFAALVANFVESYWIVLQGLGSLSAGRYTEKELINRFARLGERLYKIGEVLRPESMSRLSYSSSLRFWEEEGILIREGDRFRIEEDAEQKFRPFRERLSIYMKTARRF
jgi:glycerol-3-phosphate O-acyltransferase